MTDKEKNNEMIKMKRVWSVYCDPLINRYLSAVEDIERDRIYCRHGWDHLINTARIAYILNLENHYEISKEIIYAAALLHDIGRVREYEDQTPHDVAGAKIAREVLLRSDFNETEISYITNAILSHRDNEPGISFDTGEKGMILRKILHDADKLSRECFKCAAYASCKWSEEKKNNRLII